MSLDVELRIDKPIIKKSSGIFIRENGHNVEITASELNQRYPNQQINIDEYEESVYETDIVFDYNITHNLNTMADAAGIYEYLWRPEEVNIEFARDLIEPLRNGLHLLKLNPEEYKKYNPENGWGSYEGLVTFVEKYLDACYKYPDAKVLADR
jgi:hypothetical protein